ncbi:nucleotidyltransferase family protein [Candidatus Woesearchaeota archaeon]|nr:nucleotidyltransferase family protein [Candidatus Woesearchaeota archaeon]
MDEKQMIKTKQLHQIANVVMPILKRNGVRKAGIFGSYARGEMRKSSDLDLLVEVKKDASLLDFVHLKLELESKLRKKVDLVEYNVLQPRLKDKVLHDEIRIL